MAGIPILSGRYKHMLLESLDTAIGRQKDQECSKP